MAFALLVPTFAGLIQLLVVLIVVGLVLYLVQTYLPLPPIVKNVITVIFVLVLCLWLLQWVGVI